VDRGNPSGGSAALADLIDEHGEAIVSDLLHYYRVDVRELFSDSSPLSPRYVLSLITHLPTEGALYASYRGGPKFRGWDAGRYALVAQVNAQRATNHILTLVNRDPNKTAPDLPDPFPTPDDDGTTSSPSPAPGSFAAVVGGMMAEQRRMMGSNG